MSRGNYSTLLVVLVVLASVALPAAALSTASTAASDLQVAVEQSSTTGDATVSVSRNGTAIENATITVSGDAYAGNGTYSTDANGTVALPNPNATVDLSLAIDASGSTVTKDVTLVPLNESLAIDVMQGPDGNATITVTQYGDAVENASVTVSGDAYAGNGSYVTDANGTVWLPSPDQVVNVTITAEHANVSAETSTSLQTNDLALDVSQGPDGNVTVTVTRNGNAVENATVDVSGDAYAGNGTYSTDANGTVWLPAPDQPVDVTITATEGNDTVSASGTLVTNELSLAVSQDGDGNVTVTITRNGNAVENATVTVSGDAYAGNGSYSTDANGTVWLPSPDQPVDVTITAAEGNDTVSRSVHLLTYELSVGVVQHDDKTATVTVTRNGNAVEGASVNVTSESAYAGTGTYTTDANGTVSLPAPDHDGSIAVTASHDGDTAAATASLAGTKTADALGIGVSQGADRVVIAVTDNGVRQNATVTLSGDSSIAGTYQTGADGFVVLDAPNQAASVTVRAETANATGQRDVAIVASRGRGPSHTPFGKYVSAYVDSLHHDASLTGGYGQYVSDFVHSFKDNGKKGQGNGHGNGSVRGNGHGANDAGAEAGPDGHPGNGKAKGKK